jgi:hypothetical protein
MSFLSARLPRLRRWLAATSLVPLAILVAGSPHARANTGPCAYDVSNGAATDALTGLTWQTVPSVPASTPGQAAADCAGLVLDGSGPNVWRLPTVRELQTIVHEGKQSPAIDTSTFAVGSDPVFWTSTPDAAAPGNTWVVWFFDGQVQTKPDTEPHAVRCVH